MRGTMARRILSCVLLVSMLLSLVPSVAFTQEGSTPVPEHTHNEAGWKCTMEKVLTCENEDEDHVHDEEDCYTEVWTCQAPSDLVQLTVEYFATVDGKSLRVAETYEAVLRNGSAYSVTLPDLSEKGYTVDLDNIYIQNADGSTTMITLPMDGAISGELVEDLHYVVNYSYTELNAPYRVSYWGYDVKGENQVLLYTYIGEGQKDAPVVPSDDVNALMESMFGLLTADEVGESGKPMIDALTQRIDDQHSGRHDITPFLEAIAQSLGKAADGLTRVEIKQYLADRLTKKYALDEGRNEAASLGFTVTSDGKAEKNVYYATGGGYSILFTTGVADTIVVGIPEETVPPTTDGDGITFDYEISVDSNRITALAGVDISEYTKNGIYATVDPGKGETHRFIGWVTGPNAGVITDYTPDEAKDGGKYANLTLYTAASLIDQLTKEGYVPAKGSLVDLADQLKTMPESGATYYAVWQPMVSDYVVQIWFEDANTENLYNISHTLDIVRRAPIDSVVRHNAFDRERADETRVIEAANNHPENFPIVFTDPDSRYGVEDTYTSYQNSYVYSPFYGFDLLECDCDETCGCATGGTCDCEVCKKMQLGVDPVTGQQTTGNRCNCGGVKLDNSGKTVLNVFYTREQWQIVYHPTVELTAYKDYSTSGGTRLEGGTLLDNRETIIGRFTDDVIADMFFEGITPIFPYEYTAPRIFYYKGKYGMPVSQAHQYDEKGNLLSPDPIGEGYTGKNFSKWKEIVLNYYNGYPYADYELYVPKVGEYTNNYYQLFLGDKAKRASDLYFTTEPHNYDYYLDRNLKFESAQLPFAGVAEIQPSIYKEYVNKGKDCSNIDEDGTVWLAPPETVVMQRYTGTWKGERLSRESSYFLDSAVDGQGNTRYSGTHYEYGTHTMHLYPFYGNVDNTYTIHYYGEALPSEPDANCLTDTSTNTRYTLLQTDIVEAPCDTLFYEAKIPAGFMAKMWRTSINTNFTANDTSFTGKKVTNIVSQQMKWPKPRTQSPYYTPAGSTSGTQYNAANYQANMIMDGNSYCAYLPTWEIWQSASLKVGNLTPDGYWITDWVRLTDEPDANMTTNITDAMKARLQSSVQIGALFPSQSYNRWQYLNNMNLTNMFRYPGPNYTNAVTRATSAIALTRNKYTITYNTAFVDDQGKLLKDENGDVRIEPILTTDPIFYQQMLDGTGGVNNYYDAYFCYDPSATNPFTLLGYADAGLPDDASPNAAKIGGAGSWYLDADGTIPFNADAMSTMPAKDIDVYYRLSDVRYNVVFIDEKTGTQTKTLTMNGQEETFDHVLTNQVVRANDKAAPVDPEPECDGFIFSGWFLDEEGREPFSFDQEITKDTVVYALWKPEKPTTYTIRHVLVKPDGTEVELPETQKDVPGQVGDTVDARALDAIYQDGTYFVPDYYSQSMTLKEDPQENVLTFIYRLVERAYVVRYREKDNETNILSPDVVVNPTTKNVVTEKYKDLEDWGWKLVSDPYETRELKDGEIVEITFWYERIPGPALKVHANKLLDGAAPSGKRFTFTLTDGNGYRQQVQAVDGLIEFEEIRFSAPGDYTFTLTEVNEGGMIRYDEAVYQIGVTVIEDEQTVLHIDGEPRITRNGRPYTDGDIQFRNQTMEVPKTDVVITKIWQDAGYSGRPDAFTVYVTAEDDPTFSYTREIKRDDVSVVVSPDGNTWTFYAKWNAHSYRIEELDVPGYVSSVNGEGNHFVITNTYMPKTGDQNHLLRDVMLIGCGIVMLAAAGFMISRKKRKQ